MTKSIICKDVFGNQYTVPVDELNIRVGVYAVIIEDNKILLTRQWDGYSLIGGGVEKGETVEESIIREVKEETGLTIMPDKIIHQATTFFKRNAEAQANQSIQLYFTHSQLHGQINNDNITDSEKTYTNGTPEWVDLDKIDSINFRHSMSLRTFYGRIGRLLMANKVLRKICLGRMKASYFFFHINHSSLYPVWFVCCFC